MSLWVGPGSRQSGDVLLPQGPRSWDPASQRRRQWWGNPLPAPPPRAAHSPSQLQAVAARLQAPSFLRRPGLFHAQHGEETMEVVPARRLEEKP